MSIESLIKKYGRVTGKFYNGMCQGVVNGYVLEIEEIEYGFTVYLYVNDGVRKFFNTIEEVDKFLFDLR